MKKILFAMVMLSSFSAFAGIENCQALAGNYTCDYNGQDLSMKVNVNKADSTLTLSFAGQSQKFIVDGQEHRSTNDNSILVSVCKDNEVITDNYYRGQLVGSTSLLKTTKGLAYTLVENSKSFVLNCQADK